VTIVRVGTNSKYSQGWEKAFGGKKKAAALAAKKTSARKKKGKSKK
jgi:hypothetical protein